MEDYINRYLNRTSEVLKMISSRDIAKVLNLLRATYERDGRIYIFGNGGSLALATHWVSDFNKTVFSHHLESNSRRFQAIRLPTTESEITAWANDVGYDMIFAGPLKNYLQDPDLVIAISSSGNSTNIIKAVEIAKKKNIPVVGLSGFDGGELRKISDVCIYIPSDKGEYELVEGLHAVILHLIIKYFRDLFENLELNKKVTIK